MPLLTVVRDVQASRAVLAVHGELDLATVSIVRDEVLDVLEARPALLVLDLSSTEFIDSTGSRELSRAAKAGAAVGVPVVAVVPPSNRTVRRVLEFMQFGDLLPLHDELPPA